MAMDTNIKDLAHLGYVVPKMKSALRRFEEEGAIVVIPPTIDKVQGVEVCLLNLDGIVPVELVAPVEGYDCPIEARLRRGGGLDHVCYYVNDLKETLGEESRKESIIICDPVFACVFKRNIAFVQRRSGLVVEFMTRAEVADNS